ncbi:MAG: hypothetical protein M1817_000383 [Caeruleum heppii]|nr:MAG: hypothetical protein M1817_000383 [Caeruleum heppii]
MPPCSRTFEIPTSPETSCITAQRPGITITLHEPSLLADNLGHKTWAASYLLARRLSFFPLPGSSVSTTIPRPRHRVLELGSGTGLVGIAAAAIWGASVHLTDLPAIADNLRNNVTANKAVIEANGGEATIGVLDWAESTRVPEDEHGYDAVLAADTLYSPLHPELLVGAVRRWLRRDKAARVMIEVPLRAAYVPQIEDFRARMAQVGLRILDEGEETGYDDWGGGEMEGLTEVTCWWSIWGWCERMAMS